jgi:hypothetical protein
MALQNTALIVGNRCLGMETKLRRDAEHVIVWFNAKKY